MTDVLYALDWTQLLLFALSAIGTGLLFIYRKHIPRWRSWWSALRKGVRDIPQLASDVQGIKFFVSPNGGGSLMDAVQRTEKAVHVITEQLDLLISTYQAEHDIDSTVGRFYCGSTGGNTYVNQTYARWLEVDRAELLGWGWLNFVHPDDVAAVQKHWDDCRAQARTYRRAHRFVVGDGAVLHVEVTAVPVPKALPIQRWVGSIKRMDGEHADS